ncbi:hypothetical protein, partial [Vibrio parahaemolyticus]|uniref:hypothetical protein n=1 Tax=Vibrio parahaemolyticus TaxID=670 RepID=UPI001A8E16F9
MRPPVTAPTAVCVALLAASASEAVATTASGTSASLASAFIVKIPLTLATSQGGTDTWRELEGARITARGAGAHGE